MYVMNTHENKSNALGYDPHTEEAPTELYGPAQVEIVVDRAFQTIKNRKDNYNLTFAEETLPPELVSFLRKYSAAVDEAENVAKMIINLQENNPEEPPVSTLVPGKQLIVTHIRKIDNVKVIHTWTVRPKWFPWKKDIGRLKYTIDTVSI
jgi:hypothetical protein